MQLREIGGTDMELSILVVKSLLACKEQGRWRQADLSQTVGLYTKVLPPVAISGQNMYSI